jgi:hypothetical protein
MMADFRRVLLSGLIVALFVGPGLLVRPVKGIATSIKPNYAGFLGSVQSVLEDADNIQNINLQNRSQRYHTLLNETQGNIQETVIFSQRLSTKILYAAQSFFDRIRSGFQLTIRSFGGFSKSQPGRYSTGGFLETGANEGAIVFPASPDRSADQKVVAQLKDTFSDEIVVVPGNTPDTGVIKPVFRRRGAEDDELYLGDDYIYLLVPVGSRN